MCPPGQHTIIVRDSEFKKIPLASSLEVPYFLEVEGSSRRHAYQQTIAHCTSGTLLSRYCSSGLKTRKINGGVRSEQCTIYSMKKSNMHRKQVRVGSSARLIHVHPPASHVLVPGVSRYVYSTENSLDQWRS